MFFLTLFLLLFVFFVFFVLHVEVHLEEVAQICPPLLTNRPKHFKLVPAYNLPIVHYLVIPHAQLLLHLICLLQENRFNRLEFSLCPARSQMASILYQKPRKLLNIDKTITITIKQQKTVPQIKVKITSASLRIR